MEGLPPDIAHQLDLVLEPDEEPIDFRKEPWSFYKRNRWVVLTTKRVYLIKKVFFGSSFDIKQVKLADAHFEVVEGILLDTLYIRVSSEPEHIINFFPTERNSTIEFFEEIEKARESEPEENIEAQAELQALAKTFYEHVITEEEYESEKKKIMDKL